MVSEHGYGWGGATVFFEGVSLFGYSILFPIILLVVLTLSWAAIYAAYFVTPGFLAAENNWIAGLGFSVSNVMRGFGFGWYYFPSGFHAELDPVIKVIAGVQSVLGVALLFFLGLGLRTRFRLR